MKKLLLCIILLGSMLSANDASLEKTLINFSFNKKILKENKKIEIGKIFNFIKRHRKYISEYNLLTVNLAIRTQKENGGNQDLVERSWDDGKVSISKRFRSNNVSRRDLFYAELRYPLYDAGKEKKMKNDKLKNNQAILFYIRAYYQAIDRVSGFKNTIKFYENKLKIELKKPKLERGFVTTQVNTITNIQSNEDYYSIQILEAKNEILSNINILTAKEQLLDLVKEPFKNSLEKLL